MSPAAVIAAPGACNFLSTCGLPPKLAQVVTNTDVVDVAMINRTVEARGYSQFIGEVLVLSSARQRHLVVDVSTEVVLFLTPEKDYRMNSNLEGFIRTSVAYLRALECPADLRAEISAIDPSALEDPDGIWAEAVHWWEVHQD